MYGCNGKRIEAKNPQARYSRNNSQDGRGGGSSECSSRNEKGLLRLTPKGETKLRQLKLREYKIKKPKRWDNKWRVLTFDIREERRATRDKIRRTLTVIGFIRLQDSVWVYPYDCENLTTLLKADFKIGKDVLYIIADSIENDSWLRKQFSLTLD
ncbi:MAG: hypothetical protein UX89_C0014G0002 [Parcubacteria group bacterium GW2011_GWA2_47_16]|nr:MAG: hypothetical protein UX89_C0014G0002 [Parcubacteria group bacterium GW2011_GWA2_47_16]